MWRSEGNVQELPLSFLWVCYRYQTWVIKLGRKWLHLLSYLRPSSGNFFIDTSLCLIWSPCSPSHVRHNTQAISWHHFNFTWGFCLGEFCVCLFGFYQFSFHLPKWVFILLLEEYSQPMYWLPSLGFQSQISYSPEVLECTPLRISYRPSLVRANTGEAVMYPVYTHIPVCPFVCGMRRIFPESQFQPWKISVSHFLRPAAPVQTTWDKYRSISILNL